MLLRSISFLILSFSVYAQAASFSPAVRDGGSRFLARSLGSACYSMDSLQRGLPCNPAMVAKISDSHVDGDFFLGSNMDYVRDAEALLNNQSEENINRLFSRREKVDGEVSIEASFQSPTWGLSIEPYRLVYVNQFQNPAMPMVDMVISEERNIKAQVASYVSENLYAGLQLRYSHVRFLGGYFSLSDALTEPDKVFQARTQNFVFFEPGFLYAWEDQLWKPQVSAVLTQVGYSSDKSDEYPIRPQGLLGASIKPLVPLGTLELGMQFQIHSETENAKEAFRGALTYQVGILQAVLAASLKEHSVGFLMSFQNFSSGLTYWSDDYNKTVFLQLGVRL